MFLAGNRRVSALGQSNIAGLCGKPGQRGNSGQHLA